MATYEKYTLHLGPYQEGNIFDIELDMDAGFPMVGVGVTIEIRDTSGKCIIKKTSYTNGGITITDQNILIVFTPDNTRNRSGKYDYEIDFLNGLNQPFATIGGTFTISKEINKT